MTLQAMCFQAVPASQVMILGQNAPKSSPKCPKIITWLAADCFKCVPGLQPTASNVCLHIFWTSHLRVRIPYAVDALVHLKRSSRPSLHLLPFCLDKLYVQSGQDRGVTRNRGGAGFRSLSCCALSVPTQKNHVQGTANNVQGTRVSPHTSPHPSFALYPNFHGYRYIELAFLQTRFLVAHNHFFVQYPPSTATHKAHISRNPASFN